MPNAPISGAPYPSATDSPNGPLQFQNLALNLDSKVIARFATTSARDAAIPSPIEGMIVWVDSPAGWYQRGGNAWRYFPSVIPTISGSFTRTDDTLNLNGPNAYTGLKTVVDTASRQGTWTTYTDANGVGVSCTTPGRYAIFGILLSDIASSRIEQLETLGTRATPMSVGAGPTSGFGGTGGSVTINAPSGINIAFRYINTGTAAGTIRGSSWSVEWLRPA